MRPFSWLVCLFLFATTPHFANAQDKVHDDVIHLVTYVELAPLSADSGAKLLKSYADTATKKDGNLSAFVIREIGRQNRFVIVETWRDKAALDAHAKATDTLALWDGLKAIEASPRDERITGALYGNAVKGGDAIYVVTHIDVIQAGVDPCVTALKQMSADTVEDAGNAGYEVLRQANRPNHFTVIEQWTDGKAFDAHTAAPHTRAFRAILAPLQGALYDERVYRAL